MTSVSANGGADLVAEPVRTITLRYWSNPLIADKKSPRVASGIEKSICAV